MRKGLGEVMVELEQIQDWDRLLDQRLGDFQTNQQQVNSGTLDEILQLKVMRMISTAYSLVKLS